MYGMGQEKYKGEGDRGITRGVNMIIKLIPYRTFKEKLKIVKEELKKNRNVEVWDKFIYTSTKGEFNELQ